MQNQFFIRIAALKLLEKIYLQSDGDLKATINVSEMTDENINKLTFQKASQYLIKKHLVDTNAIVTDEWTATITYLGIDWLEDYHNINPTDYVKN